MARRPPAPLIPQRDAGSADSPEADALAQWIMECMSKGRLTALGLGSRSAVDASLSPIASWDQEDFEKHNSPDDLAAVIMAAAFRDAGTQRGTTRYVVNAYRDDQRTHFQKYSFRLDGGLEYTDKDEQNYPPTEAGVLAMTMKHAEFAIRTYSAGQAESMRLLSQQVQELHRQNNKLAAQQYKVLDLQQAMLDRQAERDLAVRESDAKEKRKQMMFEKFLVLLPILAKKFFGGKDKGTDAILAEEQLGALLESFDEEQMRQLIPMFSDEQRVAFFTIYQEYKTRKKRLSEPGHEKGEEDAAAKGGDGPQPEPEAQAEAQPEPQPESPAEPEAQAEPQPEAAAAEGVAATAEGEAVPAAPEPAPVEVQAEAVGASPAEAVPTDAAPPEPVDRTFELMVDVLGDDLNDEKVGRIAEGLDAARRKAFLAAVEAKRARLPSSEVPDAPTT